MRQKTLPKRSSIASKVLSAALCFTFFITNCVFATTLETQSYGRGKQVLASLPTNTFQTTPFPILSPSFRSTVEPSGSSARFQSIIQALPASCGTVRTVEIPPSISSPKTIIHIQDIHQNLEAQKNIGNALFSLIREKKIDIVALEGTTGFIDLEGIRQFPDKTILREVSDFLLKEKMISGPVNLALTNPYSNPPFVGIEDISLYNANIEAFRKSAQILDQTRERLRLLNQEITERKPIVFNQPLREFDRQAQDYRAGHLSLGSFIRILTERTGSFSISIELFMQASELESKLNFNRVASERSALLQQLVSKSSPSQISEITAQSLAYRLGTINHSNFYGFLRQLCRDIGVDLSTTPEMNRYMQYVLLASAIDGEELYKSMHMMEQAVILSLCTTPEQMELVKKSKQAHLIARLIDFSMTPAEWEEYNVLQKSTSFSLPPLESFEAFYELAQKRDKAMIENLLNEMAHRNASVAVLVTGGFHATGIRNILREKNTAYLSFVPRVLAVPTESGIDTLSVFSQEKTPLDRLFEGEKLFLAQNPAPATPLKIAGGIIAAEALRKETVSFSVVQQWFQKITGWLLLGYHRLGSSIRLTWRTLSSPATSQPQSADFRRSPAGELVLPVPVRHAQWAMNSSVILAPLLSIITTATYKNIIGTNIVTFISLWFLYKILLLFSVFMHERAHLKVDGQFRRKTVLESISLTLRSFHWETSHTRTIASRLFDAVAAIFIGSDITEAHMTSKRSSPIAVRLIAKAGPMANIRLIILGIGLLLFNYVKWLAELNSPIDFFVELIGFGFISTNLLLLLINLKGTDYKAWFTGIHPGVFRMGVESSKTGSEKINKRHALKVDDSETVLMALDTARKSLINLPDYIELNDLVRSLIYDFLGEAAQKALNRGAKHIDLIRIHDDNGFRFEVVDDAPVGGIGDKQVFDIARRSEKLGTELKIQRRQDMGQGLVAVLLVPTQQAVETLIIPSPKNPSGAMRMSQEINALKASSPDEFEKRVGLISQFLSQNPEKITNGHLFFFLLVNNNHVFNKAKTILLKRMENPEETPLTPYYTELLRAEPGIIPSDVRKLAATGLFYFTSPKERQLLLEDLDMDYIDYSKLHDRTFRSKDNKQYRLRIDIRARGSIVIVVEPVLSGVLGIFFNVIGHVTRARVRNIFGNKSRIEFRFNMRNLGDVSIPDNKSLSASMRNLKLSIRGEVSQIIMDFVLQEWAKLAPVGTVLTFRPGTTQENLFPNTPYGKSFNGTGFEFSDYRDGFIAVIKNESPVENKSSAGSNGSPSANVIRILETPLILHGRISSFFDEIFHIVVGGFLGLLVPIDWSNTSLLGKEPHVTYYPVPTWKAVWFSLSAPLMWTLILISTVVMASYPHMVGLTNLWNFSIPVLIFWYAGGSSAIMVMANFLPADPPTDLHKALILLRSKNQSPMAMERIPRHVRSPLIDSKSRLFIATRSFLALFDKLFISITKILDPVAAAPRLMEHLLSNDETPEQQTGPKPEDAEDLPQKIRNLLSPILRRLDRNFPGRWAAQSHNFGYWQMEAVDRIELNDDLFIGSEFPIGDEDLDFYLTDEGIEIYENRFNWIGDPEKQSHLLRLHHFKPETILWLYEKIGRTDAGYKAKELLQRGEGSDIIVIDLFARPWFTENDPDHPSIELIGNRPGVIQAAKNRQKKFVALVIAIENGTRAFYLTPESKMKVLWRIMKLLDYQEQESTLFKGNPAQGSFENRRPDLWRRYKNQYQHIRLLIPDARAFSPALRLIRRLARLTSPLFTEQNTFSDNTPQPSNLNSSRTQRNISGVTVVPGKGYPSSRLSTMNGAPTNRAATDKTPPAILSPPGNSLKPGSLNAKSGFSTGSDEPNILTPDSPATGKTNPADGKTGLSRENPSSKFDFGDEGKEVNSKSLRTPPPGAKAGIKQAERERRRSMARRNLTASGISPDHSINIPNPNAPSHFVVVPSENQNEPRGNQIGSSRLQTGDPLGPSSRNMRAGQTPDHLGSKSGPQLMKGKIELNRSKRPWSNVVSLFIGHDSLSAVRYLTVPIAFTFLVTVVITIDPVVLSIATPSSALTQQTLSLLYLLYGTLVSFSLVAARRESNPPFGLSEFINLLPFFGHSTGQGDHHPSQNGFGSPSFLEVPVATSLTEQWDPGSTSPVPLEDKLLRSLETNSALRHRAELALGITTDSSSEGDRSPETTKAAPNPINPGDNSFFTLLTVEAGLQILLDRSAGMPTSILSDIATNKLSELDKSLLLQLAKAVQRAALLSRDRLGDRKLFGTDDPGAEPVEGRNEVSKPVEPIEFEQIQQTALVLRDHLIQEMERYRNGESRNEKKQIAILKTILRNPVSVGDILQELNPERKFITPFRLDPSPHRKSQTRTKSDLNPNINRDAEENRLGGALSVLPAVEEAVKIISDQSSRSPAETLDLLAENQLSRRDTRLVAHFAAAVSNVGGSNFRPVFGLTDEDVKNMSDTTVVAAGFLIGEMKLSPSFTTLTGSASKSRTTGPRLFSLVRSAVLFTVIGAGIALALAHGLLDFESQIAVTKSTSLLAGLSISFFLFSFKNSFAQNRSGSVLHDTREQSSKGNLEPLADLIIQAISVVANGQSGLKSVDLDSLLPPTGSLGVSGMDIAHHLIHLNSADSERLNTLIRERLKKEITKSRLSETDVQRILQWLVAHSGLAIPIKNQIGDKDLAMAAEGGSEKQRAADAETIETLLPQLSPQQRLILVVSNASDRKYMEKRFSGHLKSSRVIIKESDGLFSENTNGRVLELSRFAAGLQSLTRTELQNLIVVIPNGVAWNSSQIDPTSALMWVSFVLLKDFVTGVPLERVDILHIEKLARVIAVQS